LPSCSSRKRTVNMHLKPGILHKFRSIPYLQCSRLRELILTCQTAVRTSSRASQELTRNPAATMDETHQAKPAKNLWERRI
jgi:hypothetical protein